MGSPYCPNAKNSEKQRARDFELKTKEVNQSLNCFVYHKRLKSCVSAITKDSKVIRVNIEHNHSGYFGRPAIQKILNKEIEIRDLILEFAAKSAVSPAALPAAGILDKLLCIVVDARLMQIPPFKKQNKTVAIFQPLNRIFISLITFNMFEEFLQYNSRKDYQECFYWWSLHDINPFPRSSQFFLALKSQKIPFEI